MVWVKLQLLRLLKCLMTALVHVSRGLSFYQCRERSHCFICVGAALEVSPDWSQKTMTCHSFNCFSIVWGQGQAPLVTCFPRNCYMTPLFGLKQGKFFRKHAEFSRSILPPFPLPRISSTHSNKGNHLLCNYCKRSHLDKVDLPDCQKVAIHSKKFGCEPISCS